MEKIMVSKHFSLREMTKSQTAERNGIDNTPTPEIIAAGEIVAVNVLEPVRMIFNIPYAPSSWYRGEELEKAICWKPFLWRCKRKKIEPTEQAWGEYFLLKQHPKGSTVDIEVPSIPNQSLFKVIKENCEFDELILEFHDPSIPDSGWVHVSSLATGNRRIVREIN